MFSLSLIFLSLNVRNYNAFDFWLKKSFVNKIGYFIPLFVF